MRDRTIMVNSMSKTYAVTGWRVGWVAASPDLTESIRKVHDFLTVGAAAPLQEAGVVALGLPDEYYKDLARHYQTLRDKMISMLDHAGFRTFRPRGAYYAMADISTFQSASGFKDDVEFTRHLIEHVGIAAVPGSSFFFHPQEGASLIRFCFCKKLETLELANERLRRI
jgi:aspartate/methionine/tyrosine aminotransferase